MAETYQVLTGFFAGALALGCGFALSNFEAGDGAGLFIVGAGAGLMVGLLNCARVSVQMRDVRRRQLYMDRH